MNAIKRSLLLVTLGLGLPTGGFAQGAVLRATGPERQVAELRTLPAAPADGLKECRTAPPNLAAGKAVAAAGWQVISEYAFDDHTLVTFAAQSSPGPEGLCDFENGALAVYEGPQLLGLFWTEAEVFGDLRSDRSGIVDVYSSTFPVFPVAELQRQSGVFVLQDRPASLPECGGTVEVPQLWHAPIGEMRAALITLGWAPQASAAEDPIAAEMQSAGFPETESCSGTGVNYCSYSYARPEARLRVITIGELREDNHPTVADYELTCQERAQ